MPKSIPVLKISQFSDTTKFQERSQTLSFLFSPFSEAGFDSPFLEQFDRFWAWILCCMCIFKPIENNASSRTTHHPNDQWYWLTKRSDVEITWPQAIYVMDELNFDGHELNPNHEMNSMYKLCPNGGFQS